LKCVRKGSGRRRNTREQLRPKQMWKAAASGVARTPQFERAHGTTTILAGQPSNQRAAAHLPSLGVLLDLLRLLVVVLAAFKMALERG
jgi:hypothetical protein